MPALRILHALSSVYDSLAQDYTGEAKGVISQLIGDLDENPNFAHPDRERLIADCHEAISLIRNGKKDQATRLLLGYSNALWRQVLD